MAKAVSSLGTKLPLMISGLVESSKPKLATFVKYAKVELIPPKVSELPEVAAGFGRVMRAAKSGAWKHVTVREGWLNTLIGMELAFWFFAGECLGKGSLRGYQV